ncbi:MAG TPA: asparagine synthase (glutamine-hydrolyzing) [Novosphingobium sp.]|nr:asparagine synthase (glutamine-hydrolyzing) [Novosphingobium sp.]
MCGIAGWDRRGDRAIERDTIVAACDRIVHRGPDDSGYLIDGDFAFGMRRLSIIDLAGGHQPIDSPDGRWGIVYNGELYNHPELRRELEATGWRFRTHSDTETVLAAFVHWDDAAWPRLEGMYAAAIWDRRERRLTLARDPLGIKPLYLTRQRGGLAFASEIRALRRLPDHAFTIDERAVHDFFSFGHVQKPRSIWREVTSLEPGHVLHLGPEGEPEIARFWRPRFAVRHDLSEAQWIEETRARVQDTVEKHMLADVTVGCFLSGGVDSSAIAAAMSRVASAPVKAFTVGFPGTSIDETEAAARIARHLGMEHIVLPLEPIAAGDLLPAVQASFDEPCAATAAVPIWHLSRLAAEHVKVVLTGEGSDEIFAGYKRQRTALRAARLAPLMRAIGPLAAALPGPLKHNARKFRQAAELDSGFQRFFSGTTITNPWVRERLYAAGFHNRQDPPGGFARLEAEYFGDPECARLDPLEQFMLADLTVHMPGSLLYRTDRASMAASLEARVPFLTHQFVDWSLTMPRAMKLRGKVGKYALRRAVEPWLFDGALDNRKLGFQLPFAEWFRGDFADFARAAWHDSGAQHAGYLKPAAVEALFAEHRAGAANHGRVLYAIAMFALWWDQTFAQPTRAAA